MASRQTVGTALVFGGVAIFVLSLLTSAALAPTIGTAPGTEARQTLVGSQGGGTGLHEDGSVYLLTGQNVTWKAADADSYFDVTMLDNGSVMAGFMTGGYQDCGPYPSPCVHTGFRIIEPGPTPQVVAEYSFPVRTRRNSEVHDVEKLPSGEFLVTDMEYERIMTVTGGEVTWQWNASERYDAPADPTREDWLHINDVDVIDEDRYLVSVRNANELVVVERGAGVVDIVNEGGDPSVLNHQHNPQWLDDGAVLVADSENDRIVELHENETTGEWAVAWELRSAEGAPLGWPRDADRLANGNTLVTDSANQRIFEVNESGDVVWSYRTPLIPYEAERLPGGETVGATRYARSAGGGAGSADVPVLSFLLQALRTSVPMPFWISELHVGTGLLALLALLAGGWVRVTAD
jgi:hypothetical protein